MLASFVSVLGMGVRENMQELLRQVDECVELLDVARDKRGDSDQPVELTESETGKLRAVIRDVAGILNKNLDLIAANYGG